jgi:hypothetical protein
MFPAVAVHQSGRITNHLRVIDALQRAWKPLDERELTVAVHGGDRDRESRGVRYVIRQAGEALCCVKRLPLAGPFDPGAILATQRTYGGLRKVRVPEVLGWTQDDQNWFIVEEFVPDGMRLDDAVRLNVVSRDEAENLIADVLQDISGGASGEADPGFDEKRILAAIENSRLTDRQKAGVRGRFFGELSMMWHAPVWTSRDFLPRNILLSHGRPFLVDFDLACKTGLLGIDVLRIEFYTGWRIPFWPSRRASRDDLWVQLLFFILEENLQRTIAGESQYRKWIEAFDPEIGQLVRHVPWDFGNGRWKRTLPMKRDLSEEPGVCGSGLRGRIKRGLAKASVARPGIEALVRDIGKGKVRIRRHWASVAGEEIKYHLESQGDWKTPDQATIVSGWCFSTIGPIVAVRATVNGETHAAFYGGRRPDVKHAWNHQLSTPNVGFWVRCPVWRGYNNVTLEVFLQDRWMPLCKSVWRAAYFPSRRRSRFSYQESLVPLTPSTAHPAAR